MTTPKLISKEFAIELNQNYINMRSPIIRQSIGSDDFDCVWYSLEELEGYIAYIKAEGADKGFTVDGIRLYMGVYPSDGSYGPKAGKTTIFLSPTGQAANRGASGVSSSSGNYQAPDIIDIQPMNFGTAGNPPIIDYPLQ